MGKKKKKMEIKMSRTERAVLAIIDRFYFLVVWHQKLMNMYAAVITRRAQFVFIQTLRALMISAAMDSVAVVILLIKASTSPWTKKILQRKPKKK